MTEILWGLGLEVILPWVSVVVAALVGAATYRISRAHLESNRIQVQANQQAIFNQAVTHLGNTDSASARLGGIYGLYDLLDLEPKRLQSIANILCAHLRDTTQREEYKKRYEKIPSNEMQSLLNVLSEINKKFNRTDPDTPLLDLSYTYLSGAELKGMDLQGADFRGARLQEAYLSGARLQEADLRGARLQGANLQIAQLPGAHLWNAQLQGADLRGAWLQGADLGGARLQGANLQNARLQGANLSDAQLQEASLFGARLQGAILWNARLQGAILWNARLQGADLSSARLQGVDLSDAQLQGADLSDTQLQGAFSKKTIDGRGYNLEERIHRVLEKDTSLETTLFGGGIEKSEVDEIESNLKEYGILDQRVREIIDRIRPHVGQDANYILPPKSGAITGTLTDEMADKIIDDYKEP